MRRKIWNHESSIEKPNHKNGMRQRVTAIVATTALIASGEFAVYKTFFDKECKAPSTNSLGAVAMLFDRPTKPPGVTVETRDEFNERIEKKERELDITFPVYDGAKLANLDAELTLQEAVPFSEYLEMARGITDQLGMTISTDIPANLKKVINAQAPTQKDLETAYAKGQLVHLMRNLVNMPMTLSQNMGLKHIILTVNGTITGDKSQYGGAAIPSRGTMVLDVGGEISSLEQSAEIIPHEIEHFVDAATCGAGDSDKDPGYKDLNKTQGYAKEFPIPQELLSQYPKTFADIKPQYNTLRKAQEEAVRENDEDTYCEIENKLDELGKDVEATDSYSYKTASEDKANMGDQLFDPKDYDVALDPGMPIKRNRFLFLTARLYEKYPKVVEYYSLFGKRPDLTYKCD